MNFFKKMFPLISAAAGLGGPLGTMAANVVGKALGVSSVPVGVQAASDALQAAGATQEQIAALQAAEQDFQLKMAALGFNHIEDLEKMADEDVANARAREIAVRDNTPKILAYSVASLALAAEMIVLFHGTGPADGVIVGRILGSLDAALMLILAYYFGSSKGSDDKNRTIENLSK